MRFALPRRIGLAVVLACLVESAPAQEAGEANAANRAFEEERWGDAINEYTALVSEDRLNGVYWLRIAQAQRELGQNANALETLERARVAQAPEAMLELERARNLMALNQEDTAFRALQGAAAPLSCK